MHRMFSCNFFFIQALFTDRVREHRPSHYHKSARLKLKAQTTKNATSITGIRKTVNLETLGAILRPQTQPTATLTCAHD